MAVSLCVPRRSSRSGAKMEFIPGVGWQRREGSGPPRRRRQVYGSTPNLSVREEPKFRKPDPPKPQIPHCATMPSLTTTTVPSMEVAPPPAPLMRWASTPALYTHTKKGTEFTHEQWKRAGELFQRLLHLKKAGQQSGKIAHDEVWEALHASTIHPNDFHCHCRANELAYGAYNYVKVSSHTPTNPKNTTQPSDTIDNNWPPASLTHLVVGP